MAKEVFTRTKPHVNVGAVSQVLQDTSGQLTVNGFGSDVIGNPAPSSILVLMAPSQSLPQIATLAYPFDDEFVFNPALDGPALEIGFQVDIFPMRVEGAPALNVTMAILQDNIAFVASAASQLTGESGTWKTLQGGGLIFHDFDPVNGGSQVVDFQRAFQFGFAFSGQYSINGFDAQLAVDNMTVEITTVPEPTSIALLLAFGAIIIWRRLW